jgi:ribosomal-protein-alanine N-acetyltransferase
MSRVRLESPRAADRAEFLELVDASAGLHRPWTYPPTDGPAYRNFMDRLGSPAFECRFVRRNEDEAIVGVFEVSQIFRGGFHNAYLGYWVGAPYAGHGYMTEGMRHLFRFAFRELRLHRLEANIQPNNKASISLAKRTGFRKEGFSPRYLKIGGRWRDHERWAILAEDARMGHQGRPASRR